MIGQPLAHDCCGGQLAAWGRGSGQLSYVEGGFGAPPQSQSQYPEKLM